MKSKPLIQIFLFLAGGIFLLSSPLFAAEPVSGNWFQLHASPYTGTDDSGDGTTGLSADYNYFYVGQTFTANIQIKSENTNAANIWVDFDPTIATVASLSTGGYFPTWSGQTIGVNRLKSTGFDVSTLESGTSTNAGFGSFQVTPIKPTAVNYGTGAASVLDINTGVIGNSTESNISYLGNDILQEAEDFNFHVWADTKAPYAKNAAAITAVEDNFTFDLRDSKAGSSSDAGVGTGVNTSMPHGAIEVSTDGGATYVSYASDSGFSCSGTWSTNLCNTTINPSSPSAIAGDSRNWEYNTAYTVRVSGFRDYASASQDQLGDANGPNIMATTTFTFTTESDILAPTVGTKSPAASATNVSVSTNIVIDIVDKKSANVSGSGLDYQTCKISVRSCPTCAWQDYYWNSAEVGSSAIDYGRRFTINPASDFNQYQTVSVSVSECQDNAANTIGVETWTFVTADSDSVTVSDLQPENDSTVTTDQTFTFHLSDSGTGVSLGETVVYLNGTYYTSTGGAGSLNIDGQTINFVAQVFTTSATSTPSDYAITVNPAADFTAGEAAAMIIFSQDTQGNVMDYQIYAFAVAGGAGGPGSSYCGSNTTWDSTLAKCVGTGGGSGTCSTAPDSGSPSTIVISQNDVKAYQVNATTVLVTWYSNLAGTGRVVYGQENPTTYGIAPNYSFPNSTPLDSNPSTYHSVIVSGLSEGKVYYFRPITVSGGNEIVGPVISMAPKFSGICQSGISDQNNPDQTCPICTPLEKACPAEKICPVQKPCPTQTPGNCLDQNTCPDCPLCQICPATTIINTGTTDPTLPGTGNFRILPGNSSLLKILDIRYLGIDAKSGQRSYQINGTATPSTNLKLIIY